MRLCQMIWQGLWFFITISFVVMSSLTVIAIFLVSEKVLDITFDVDFSIFAAGCIFPTTFSVAAAFKRREKVLGDLATFKSSLFSLFTMFQFYDVSDSKAAASQARPVFDNLITHLEEAFRERNQIPSTVMRAGGQTAADSKHHEVYDDFTMLAEALTHHSVEHFGYPPDGKPVTSATGRCWEFLHAAIHSYEQIRAVHASSTPVGLRLFCYCLSTISCVALAPYWAHFCKKEHFTGDREFSQVQEDIISIALPPEHGHREIGYGCASAYLLGIFFTFIVFTLYRVSEELENPFDGRGLDDVQWDAWREELQHLGYHGTEGPRMRSKQPEPEPAAKTETDQDRGGEGAVTGSLRARGDLT